MQYYNSFLDLNNETDSKYNITNVKTKRYNSSNKNTYTKILGKGTYGCVIPNKIICNKDLKDTLSKPSKLFTNYEDYKTEIKNTSYVNKYDKGNTSITIYNYCTINKNILDKIIEDNNNELSFLKQCNFLNKNILYQIIYNERGIPLDNIKKNIFDLFILGYNLLKGIYLFNKIKFLHMDIKFNNIIYINHKLLFIDFGLSSKYNDFLNHDIHDFIDDCTFNHPPEFIAIRFALKKKYINYNDLFNSFKTEYENNVGIFVVNNFIIKYCYYNDKKLYIKDLYKTFNIYYNSTNPINLLKNTLNKIDIYGYGMTFVWLLLNKNISNIYINDNDSRKIIIYNIISKCIIINPYNRYNTKNIMLLYNKNKLI